jgi:hypothetical protein
MLYCDIKRVRIWKDYYPQRKTTYLMIFHDSWEGEAFRRHELASEEIAIIYS